MSKTTGNNKAWKIINIILNCIFYIFIALVLLFSIVNLKKKDELDIPSLFGRGYLTVLTDSMTGTEKDSFTEKDLIFVKVLNDKNREKAISKLEVGDIITFKYYNDVLGKDILNSHRIVDKTVNSEGKDSFVTQGDKAASNPRTKYEKVPTVEKDKDYNTKYEVIPYENVRAIYTGKMGGVGSGMKFMQTPNGFLICIVIPTALFFIFEAIVLVINFSNLKSKKKEIVTEAAHNEEMANMKAELEAEREKMRLEILAEMEAKKEVEEDSKENNEETKEE